MDRPVEHWHHVLTWLTSAQARRGFVSEGMPAVTLVTASVRYGDGPEVSGPPAALALALCGRDARLTQLSGPGLEVFARWVGRGRGNSVRRMSVEPRRVMVQAPLDVLGWPALTNQEGLIGFDLGR